MDADIAQLGQELKHEVEIHQEEENKRSYDWLEQCSVNIWEFRDSNPALMRSLADELDITEWDQVAADLGLSYQQIERCRKCHRGSFTREVLATLEEYPEHRDMTLRSFLEVLLLHERHDILLKLEQYARLGVERSTTARSFSLSIQREGEVLVAAEGVGCVDAKQTEFRAKVLLIHAHDAREDALQLASQLRRPVGRRKLCVLLLQESDNRMVRLRLGSDPWNSINAWFAKVDVVVPVLSPQFLCQIQNRDLDSERGWEKRYNRFVYSLTLEQFVEYGCKNWRCRAVCPARYSTKVNNNGLIKHSGLLKPHWNCSSEEQVEQCANILYDGAKEFKKLRKTWKKEQMQCDGAAAEVKQN